MRLIGNRSGKSSRPVFRLKRIAWVGAAVVALFSLVWLLSLPDPDVPRFKLLRGAPVLPPSAKVSYFSYWPRPFEGGRMWITVSISGTNIAALLYDIDDRKILGQLLNGWPVLMASDGVKSVCAQPVLELRWRLYRLLDSVTRRLSRASPQTAAALRSARPAARGKVRYWLLDLVRNSASRIGEAPLWSNALFPSPDFRYAFSELFNASGGMELYCFDLRRCQVKNSQVPSWGTWWDNTRILLATTNHDFVLYDVVSEKTTPFLSSREIAAFLQEHRLAEETRIGTFSIWNGREYDVYLADEQQKSLATASFLIEVGRPDGRLKLQSRHFRFGVAGHLDPTQRYYLYCGSDPRWDTDGVFVRDLQSGVEHVLVEPNAGGYHSLPRFYRDSVIYVRSNALWRINLDGANNTRLFPPPDAGFAK